MSDASNAAGGGRRAVRRAVDVECDVVFGNRDEPVACKTRDLSPIGVWLETSELAAQGDRVVLTFRPPKWPSIWNITVFGTITRLSRGRRESDAGSTGMAVEFVDLTDAERAALEDCLAGLPMPRARSRNR